MYTYDRGIMRAALGVDNNKAIELS
jgi:hypothetical protein